MTVLTPIWSETPRISGDGPLLSALASSAGLDTDDCHVEKPMSKRVVVLGCAAFSLGAWFGIAELAIHISRLMF